MAIRFIAVIALLSVSAAACGTQERRSFENEGSMCLGVENPWAPGVLLEPGEEVEVKLVFSDCISSCVRDIETSCSLEARWGGYVVESAASYRVPGGACDDACQVLEADCGTITVGEGEVLVRHGDEYHYFTPGEAGSCSTPDEGEEPRPREVFFEEPPGTFCTNEAPQPDQLFGLYFLSQQCLSSSCTEDYEASCLFSVKGQEIDVSVAGSYKDLTFLEDGVCTEDCGIWTGECTELALPEGTYTLQYGGELYTLNVPGEADSCL